MTIKNALTYALGSERYAEAEKCHAALLETLRAEAEGELAGRYPCVLNDTTGSGATAPPATLQASERRHWTKAVGLMTAAMFLRSGDGRQMFTQIKKRVEKEASGSSESTEETFKPVDTDTMADSAESEAIGAMKQISCVSAGLRKSQRIPSLFGTAAPRGAGCKRY